MDMWNFILHRSDILSVQVKIQEEDYIFGVQWKAPEKPYDDTWILKSYSNMSNGEKDLSKEQVEEFMDAINAKWNWNVADFQK